MTICALWPCNLSGQFGAKVCFIRAQSQQVVQTRRETLYFTCSEKMLHIVWAFSSFPAGYSVVAL